MSLYSLFIIPISFFLASLATAAETALNNYPRSKIKSLFERLEKKQKYSACSSLVHMSLLIVRTLGNILVIVLLTLSLTSAEYTLHADVWIFFIGIIAVFLILIFLGQILPSAIAARSPEKFIQRIFPMIKLFYVFFKPLSAIFVMIGKEIAPEGIRSVYGGFITEEELIDVIEAGEKEGAIEKEEKQMLHSVIEFGDKIVREVMIPRIDMICLEENAGMDDVLKLCAEEKFSRVPVYKENVDNIVGILYVRDLLDLWQYKCGDQNRSIKEILHLPFFVPETKLISDLFREFKAKKTHMAVAVDEYGGTAGLITLEDLIEEIVGEIQDEYDSDEEKPIRRIGPGKFIVLAKTPVDEINKNLDLNLEESDDFDTIGGFLFSLMGKVPNSGEFVKYKNLDIVILEADERSIKKIKITRISRDQDKDERGND